MKNFQQEISETSGWLSKIGADPSGGMTRLLYTPEWVEAQRALKQAFETAGLATSFDAVGNLSGRLQGSKYPDQVILSGSHIDTVVNGGNLDGQFGIEAAYLAIKHLKETYGAPLRTLEVISLAEEEGDPLVLTFGKVEPKPNTVNVVPGFTHFTLDCRHTDKATLLRFTQEIEADIQRICAEMGIEVEIDLWMDETPIPMDKQLLACVSHLCESHKMNYRMIHSGAGHDSQIFAPHVPTVMMFVPSIAGISHNPAEKTELSDLVEGVKILAHTLYQLAYTEQGARL